MPLKSLVHTGTRIFGIKLNKTVSSFRNSLAAYGINGNEFSIINDKINFKSLGITIHRKKALPLLENYETALKLVRSNVGNFFVDSEGNLNIKIRNLQFKINEEEELFILCEVFLEGSYNLITPTEKKITVIDIGMNVGITTLFFASQANVRKVISFEPFLPTYNMALENLALNKFFASKVEMQNFGLGEKNDTLQVDYSLKQKGKMGLNGVAKNSNVSLNNFRKETIVLKSVAEEFIKIRPSVKDDFVVCKIDCEGAEYEITDTLSEQNLLSIPDVYFIEWHYKSPVKIVSNLIAANYHVINTTFHTLNSGMIYAIKTSGF